MKLLGETPRVNTFVRARLDYRGKYPNPVFH